MTNQGKNEDEDEKIWKNKFSFGILYINIRLYRNIFDPFYRTFLTNRDKNENEDEKIWENESDFLILHIKIRLCGNFHENRRKIFLTHLLKHF